MRRTRIAILMAGCVVSVAWQSTGDAAPSGLVAWVQTNIFALVIFVFHFGVAWREFLDHRRRIVKTETFLEEKLPETYARQDNMNIRFDSIDRTLEEIRTHLT